VLLSALACPGAGQIYKRQFVKGGILVAASLIAVAAIVVKTWTALIKIAIGTPPEELMFDVFGMAHRVMEAESGFFYKAGMFLLVLWIYAVVDAALSPAADGGAAGGPGHDMPEDG